MPHETQAHRAATRTSTRPPPITTSSPCPYRTGANVFSHYPFRLLNIIGTEATLPVIAASALWQSFYGVGVTVGVPLVVVGLVNPLTVGTSAFSIQDR